MGQQNNFLGGFVLGTLLGGVVGGVAGVLVSSRLPSDNDEDEGDRRDASLDDGYRSSPLPSDRNIETARRSLEDKIAQLNTAIDDVRTQLSTVNEHTTSQNGEKVMPD